MTKSPQFPNQDSPPLQQPEKQKWQAVMQPHSKKADRLRAARQYLAKLKEEVPTLNVNSYLQYRMERIE